MKLHEITDRDRSMLDITVTSKDAGPDQIKPSVLKKRSTALSPILKHLFQKSLDSGTVSPIWKDANVTSVYKKGNALNLPTTGPYPLPVFFVKHYST